MPVTFPVGAQSLRMSVYNHTGALLILDASNDLKGGIVSYEDTPSGCGAAQLTLGMTYEQVEAAGYYTARNILEISSGDDEVQTTTTLGATKIYVGSKIGYDIAQGHDVGQIAIFDGSTLTMRIPVTGVGTDGGGDFITVGAPIAGGGNPTTIPSYVAGSTIYRRRYSGIVMGRQRPNQKAPSVIIKAAGLSQRINEAVCTFALSLGSVDMGTAIFDLLSQFSSRWPELTVGAGNFPLTGQTSFDGSYQSTQVARVVGDLLAAANSSGDQWVLRTGHDRIPRLTKTYTQVGNAYSYNVTLPQGVTYFEPRTFINADQDASRLYNSIEVIGDMNPATQQPVQAIAQDSTSITNYGQIDAQPVTNTACKTIAQCVAYAQSLLNQQATPRSNAQFVMSTRNDYANTGPMGLSRGDVVLGLHNVTVSAFEGAAANVYGIVSSVVTTIEPAGDTYQQVRFSAIEPDWNEAAKERANALSMSLLQNTLTGAGITSYCVSSNAFPASGVSSAGLVVTAPTFLALFAQGSAPINAGGNTFTLANASTNWVWLLSNGSWVVNQNATFVSNAILYGIYTTSASVRLTTESGIDLTTESGIDLTTESGSVIGFIQKAPVGVVTVAQAQLPSMGAQGAPSLTGVSPITYPVVGNGTYDAEVTLTVDVATASWLVGVSLFAVPHGSSADPRAFPKGIVPVQESVSGTYTLIWKSIGAGNIEDLYLSYIDGQGRLSPVVLVGTTVANPAGTVAFLAIPITAPNPTSAASGFTYYAQGASTYDAEATIYLDANGQSGNNALAEIEVVMAPVARGLTSASTGWTPVGADVRKNGTGTYVVTAGGLGAGTAYSIGIRYVGHTGDRSNVYILGTTVANPQVLTNLPSMGAQGAPAVNGPSGAPVGIGNFWVPTYPVVGSATFDAVVTFTVDVTSAPWLTGIGLFAVPVGTVTDPRKSPIGFLSVGQSSAGVYTATWAGLGGSNSTRYGLFIAYEDAQGIYSAVTEVAETVANPVGTSGFASLGTAAPVASSALPPAFAYYANGGGTYDAIATVTLTGTTANNALAEIECVMAPHAQGLTSASTGWASSGAPEAVNASGVYVLPWGGCGVQVPYDVGVRYVGHDGARTNVLVIGTTTAAQLAQLPFVGATIDPATGYIVIADQAIYPSAQAYNLGSGVGSLLSASWNHKSGSTSISPSMWLFYTAASGGNGYLLQWYGVDGKIYVFKLTAGTFVQIAVSTATYTRDATNFHNLEFIATQTTAGSVVLTAIIDGAVACQTTDSSSPYTSGPIAAQFRDASATNYIDEKTVQIDFGGSASSSPTKAQGSIFPVSLPPVTLSYYYDNATPANSFFYLTAPATTIRYTDGSTIAFSAYNSFPGTTVGGTGTIYSAVGYDVVNNTLTSISSINTALTDAQKAAFLHDGTVPINVNFSYALGTGFFILLNPNYGGRSL